MIEDGAALEDPGPGPVAACERLARQAQVKRVLGELSRRSRRSISRCSLQRLFDGRTSAEVADALGLTPEQVRFRLHRMKQKFRDLFETSASLRLSTARGVGREIVRKMGFSRNTPAGRVDKGYQGTRART